MYAKILLWAIPSFLILVLIEILYGHFTKKQTYSLMDTLSSLSSGVTNILKDTLGIGIILISYPFLKSQFQIIRIEESILLYVVAFICIDFASYWSHRLNHSINVFWNNHVVHHSSEEFNLACALRQSISNLLSFGALFLIPAAVLGVPHNVIVVLAPLHLFGQFWYHTRHIGKLGWLEYILVTPSQHRVHHAINPEYVDKNLAAIFSVWDRLFGTFQEEMEDIPCVFGTLKPVQTWNPVLINFQHLWGLIVDAWRAKSWIDKLKIWWMPTGWRPQDVALKFPRKIVQDVYSQSKYAPEYNFSHKAIALFHFISLNVIISLFLSSFGELQTSSQISYGILIFVTIFGFTSLMDGHKWAAYFELTRALVGLIVIFYPTQQYLWQTEFLLCIGLSLYFLLTLIFTVSIRNSLPKHQLIVS